jgi:hypothetical protein
MLFRSVSKAAIKLYESQFVLKTFWLYPDLNNFSQNLDSLTLLGEMAKSDPSCGVQNDLDGDAPLKLILSSRSMTMGNVSLGIAYGSKKRWGSSLEI